MKLLLLYYYDLRKSYFVVAEDAVEGAKVLCKTLGLPDYYYIAGKEGKPDQETPISVSGTWTIEPGLIIDVRSLTKVVNLPETQ